MAVMEIVNTHYRPLGRSLSDAPPAKVVLAPPLRTEQHREALRRGLRAGSLGVASSDLCPSWPGKNADGESTISGRYPTTVQVSSIGSS